MNCSAEGIDAEVIDLATLKPYDEQTVLGSIAKTGRCVIVHEAARTGGFGAEIAALIAERGLLSLLAPVIRVTGYDTVIPMPRLEQYYHAVGRAHRRRCPQGLHSSLNLAECPHAPVHAAGSRRRSRRGGDRHLACQ